MIIKRDGVEVEVELIGKNALGIEIWGDSHGKLFSRFLDENFFSEMFTGSQNRAFERMPEEKYIPHTMASFISDRDKWIKTKNKNFLFKASLIREEGIECPGFFYSWENLLEYCTYWNGSPVGQLVVE